MGAAGSVMTSSENEDRDQSNVEDPPSKTARVSESLNMKSKFPSFAQPSKSDTPSSAATIFKVTIAFEIPFIRELQLFETYLLRLSMESLDIIVEGTENPILQFPYQNISSWGSSPTSFQFAFFDHQSKMDFEDHSIERDVDSINEVKGMPIKHLKNKESKGRVCDSHDKDKEKEKETDTCDEDSYKKESLDDNPEPESVEVRANVSKKEEVPCNKRDPIGSKSRLIKKQPDDIHLIFKTSQATVIENALMCAVRCLMVHIDFSAVSKVEFEILLSAIIEPTERKLQANWEDIIKNHCGSRLFLARQAMDLIVLIGPIAPFEKFEIARLLYTKVLNKESFDLVINTFDDVKDRENLIYLLKIDKKSKMKM